MEEATGVIAFYVYVKVPSWVPIRWIKQDDEPPWDILARRLN